MIIGMAAIPQSFRWLAIPTLLWLNPPGQVFRYDSEGLPYLTYLKCVFHIDPPVCTYLTLLSLNSF